MPACELFYQDIPRFFWFTKDKRWCCQQRKSDAIGRIFYVLVIKGEHHFLSFVDLRTVDDHVHATYRAAAEALGLLISDLGSFHIKECLKKHNEDFAVVGLDQPNQRLCATFALELTPEQVSVEQSQINYSNNYYTLTPTQSSIVDHITHLDLNNVDYNPFINRPGGCGKTYVFNTLIHYFNSQQIPVATVASLMSDTVQGEENHNRLFSEWLLRLGNGLFQHKVIKRVHLAFGEGVVDSQKLVVAGNRISFIYENLRIHALNLNPTDLGDYFTARIILTPLNINVKSINDRCLAQLPGTGFNSRSVDTMENDDPDAVPEEVLHTLRIPNFLDHTIQIKKNMPIILLCLLNLANDLSNGTRLLVTNTNSCAFKC
ncbi:hypothetical protein MJO28_015357 [Puccinia striiformis f. sp. tritici]|uniref:Uncharacterized protein n=1 Tax=Puccinia striiformis f. sp. tritici TaxID=168172 RepID=A0ACC0DSI0_9BASI|nr:hypothetical protein MJO28_015357 [Puccinia striiformis f. sp. tritici]